MSHITAKRTGTILQALQDKQDMESCACYGERGYTDPENGILFCNWNNVSKRVMNYLESAGFELEWSDEWYIDYDNSKAWRTSPDSYSWVRAIVYTEDGEVLTPDDGAGEVIEALAMTDQGHTPHAVPDWVSEDDLESAGYTAINGMYESGFHPGQDDNPADIAKSAFDRGAESVIFRIDNVGQFDVHFQGFARYPEVQS